MMYVVMFDRKVFVPEMRKNKKRKTDLIKNLNFFIKNYVIRQKSFGFEKCRTVCEFKVDVIYILLDSSMTLCRQTIKTVCVMPVLLAE